MKDLCSLNGCLVLNNSVAYNDVIETETQKSVLNGGKTWHRYVMCDRLMTGLLSAGNKQVKSLTVQQYVSESADSKFKPIWLGVL